MSRKVLIIGCGYLGLPLALRLQEAGCEINAWVRSAASAEFLTVHRFHRVIVGNIAEDRVWEALAEKVDVVIHSAASGGGGAEAYREVYLNGVRRMNAHQSQARRLFVSSTSVYGQTQGEIVTEESPAEPVTETGRILCEAESAALDSGCIVVRSSGIYGPGRGLLFEKFRQGEAVIEGDGSRWLNQIHQSDLVAAVLHLIEVGQPGHIYNATDDVPVTLHDYYAWWAEYLSKPMPPYGPVNSERKRGLTNKRVSNAKLQATGWLPQYPSFREGLAADYRATEKLRTSSGG